jgi:hypothetical protein
MYLFIEIILMLLIMQEIYYITINDSKNIEQRSFQF